MENTITPEELLKGIAENEQPIQDEEAENV